MDKRINDPGAQDGDEFEADERLRPARFEDMAGQEKVKDKLLFQLTNFGQPFIYVQDGNFENRGELLLKHDHQGTDLRQDYSRDTLANVCRVWKRPVNILTQIEGKGRILRFDGSDHSEKSADYPEA